MVGLLFCSGNYGIHKFGLTTRFMSDLDRFRSDPKLRRFEPGIAKGSKNS